VAANNIPVRVKKNKRKILLFLSVKILFIFLDINKKEIFLVMINYNNKEIK